MINTTNWKKFKISDLFNSISGDTDIKQHHINDKGLPVITSGLSNNGLLGLSDVKAKVIPRNTITVDMFGNTFYRNYNYKMVTHARVFALNPKFNMSINIGLYFSSTLFYLSKKFDYSNMCSYEKIKNETISLPTINDKPNFDYMEEYIEEIKLKYIDILEKNNNENIDKALKITGLSYQDLNKDLTVKPAERYEQFRIGKLFDSINKTAIINNANKRPYKDETYNIPALSSTVINNSFGYYANPKEHNIIDRLCLSVTSNGDAGTLFLQNEPFVIAQDAYVIYLKDNSIKNIGIYLYLKTVIEKITKQKYNYNNKAVWNKVKNEKITLPAIDENTPDFDYMEKAIYIYIYILQRRLNLKNYLTKRK